MPVAETTKETPTFLMLYNDSRWEPIVQATAGVSTYTVSMNPYWDHKNPQAFREQLQALPKRVLLTLRATLLDYSSTDADAQWACQEISHQLKQRQSVPAARGPYVLAVYGRGGWRFYGNGVRVVEIDEKLLRSRGDAGFRTKEKAASLPKSLQNVIAMRTRSFTQAMKDGPAVGPVGRSLGD